VKKKEANGEFEKKKGPVFEVETEEPKNHKKKKAEK